MKIEQEQIVKEVDNFRDGDPVYSQLLNRNASFGLARHMVEWAGKSFLDKACEVLTDKVQVSPDIVYLFRKAMEGEL